MPMHTGSLPLTDRDARRFNPGERKPSLMKMCFKGSQFCLPGSPSGTVDELGNLSG